MVAGARRGYHCGAAGGTREPPTAERWAMTDGLAPGDWVKNPQAPEWGLGQVQSVIGERVTVNFENAGKRLINAAVVTLDRVELPASANDDSY